MQNDNETKGAYKKAEPTFHLNLPSLAKVSIGVLFALYSFLFVVVVLLVELNRINLTSGVVIYVGIIFVQFFLAPIIMDWMLKGVGSLSWVELSELPHESQSFILNVCQKYNMSTPKMGIIEDISPQAFTYGNTPSNARLVISRGLIEMLTPDELNAVIAHELGHIQHRDFIFMTIAQLVPIVLYAVYKLTMGDGDNKKNGSPLAAIGILAYALYFLSQYIVLFLSRVREYWADRFSLENISDPNALGRALVKISTGSGVKRLEPLTPEEIKEQKKKRAGLWQGTKNPVLAFNIAGTHDGNGWAASAGEHPEIFAPENDEVRKLMRWDLWNPWSKIFELSSTHPVMGKRLVAVGEFAAQKKIESPFIFNLIKPPKLEMSLFDDLLVYFLPHIISMFILVVDAYFYLKGGGTTSHNNAPNPLLLAIAAYGAASLLRNWFFYPMGVSAPESVNSVLKRVTVSPINPSRVELRGKVIGRGLAGNLLSSDLFIQDETGMIFLAVRSAVPLYDLFFALKKSQKYIGQDVVIEGWYRRQPSPYIEVHKISVGSEQEVFRSYLWSKLICLIVLLVPLYFIFK